jgi:hypothetical protein
MPSLASNPSRESRLSFYMHQHCLHSLSGLQLDIGQRGYAIVILMEMKAGNNLFVGASIVNSRCVCHLILCSPFCLHFA